VPYLELPDGLIHYVVHGERGRWIALVHGMFASHRWWREQVRALSTLYRVLAVDLRGHGGSSPLRRRIDIAKFSEDLRHLLDSLNIEELALVGWSLGGLVAMDFASRYPDRVKALVLLTTRARRSLIRVLKTVGDYVRGRLFWLMVNMFYPPGEVDRILLSFMRREVERSLSKRASEDLIDWIVNEIASSRREGAFNVLLSAVTADVRSRLRGIKAPTLIIAGGRDKSIPLKYSEEIHKEVASSKLVVLEGCGHYALLECADEVNELILSFLREVGYA